MAIPIVAILAGLDAVSSLLSNKLIMRLLQNWSHGTLNKLDDAVIDILCSNPEDTVPKELEKMQENYDATPERTKEAMKAEPSQRVELTAPEVQAKLREVMGDSYPFPPMP